MQAHWYGYNTTAHINLPIITPTQLQSSNQYSQTNQQHRTLLASIYLSPPPAHRDCRDHQRSQTCQKKANQAEAISAHQSYAPHIFTVTLLQIHSPPQTSSLWSTTQIILDHQKVTLHQSSQAPKRHTTPRGYTRSQLECLTNNHHY